MRFITCNLSSRRKPSQFMRSNNMRPRNVSSSYFTSLYILSLFSVCYFFRCFVPGGTQVLNNCMLLLTVFGICFMSRTALEFISKWYILKCPIIDAVLLLSDFKAGFHSYSYCAYAPKTLSIVEVTKIDLCLVTNFHFLDNEINRDARSFKLGLKRHVP